MNRRHFVKAAGLAVSGAMLGGLDRAGAMSKPAAPKAGTRPNIVLIMADDMGYEALGCNGAAEYKTPNLDAMAAGGIRFTNCYSQPLCTPSRVKIMTGRYNVRNYKHFGHLDPGEITFANVVKKAGYKTCVAGKWQLGPINNKAIGAFGFDSYCLWTNGFERRYNEPNVSVNGVEYREMEGKYGPDLFCGHITDFIEAHRDEPFFAYYPMVLTHDPFVPTPDSADWPEMKGQKDVKYFADMVAYADKMVGRIVTKLDELGIRDNTILMFTGDNGAWSPVKTKMKDGTVIQGAKGSMTDGGTHVPFVASWPAQHPRGVVLDDLIDFSDFFVTIAEAAGAELPDVKIDGVSFLGRLKGQAGTPREWTYCFHFPNKSNNPNQTPLEIFVRDKRYKLYHDGRLYDLRNDPLEQKPILFDDDSPEQGAIRMKLFKVLVIPT